MRRIVTVLLSAGALATAVANGAAAATKAAGKAAPKKKVVTKKFVGQSVDANQWGTVQISVTERITTIAGSKKAVKKYVDLGGSYSYHTSRSQYIMSTALPMLRQEFLTAQSPNVQMISGATYTSQAFEQSLQSALAKANA